MIKKKEVEVIVSALYITRREGGKGQGTQTAAGLLTPADDLDGDICLCHVSILATM